MGGPVLLLIAFGIVLFGPVPDALEGAREILALTIAAFFGCKVAYHLHMRSADAYGGAYTNPQRLRRARARYLIACVVYAAVAVVLAHLVVEARA